MSFRPSASSSSRVLVTGATAGIGLETALHLARLGHHVIATGRSEESIAALRKRAAGLPLETIALDVDDAASIAAAKAEVDRISSGIDVLVNNAGFGMLGPLESLSDQALRAQFETNVFGLMAVTRAFLPGMRAQGRGRIVNISSIAGRFTLPFAGAYHASKYAVEALSDALRNELRPFGIEVVLIEPGPIRSEFSPRAVAHLREQSSETSPYAASLRRLLALRQRQRHLAGTPEDVAEVIARAIQARRPRARYVVPLTGRAILSLFEWLPTPLADALARRMMGLSKR